MNSWTEFHIGVVYYSGLIISFMIGVGALLYLRPFQNIRKLAPWSGTPWGYQFVTTVMMVGLLGAMSVSFTGCDCSYDCLLNSPSNTISKGLTQISTASIFYAILFGMWFIVLLVIRIQEVRKTSFNLLSKVIFVSLLMTGVVRIYYVLNND